MQVLRVWGSPDAEAGEASHLLQQALSICLDPRTTVTASESVKSALPASPRWDDATWHSQGCVFVRDTAANAKHERLSKWNPEEGVKAPSRSEDFKVLVQPGRRAA